MNCIVVGAGNAGRPVAKLLNYVDHQVQIIDQKKLEEFPKKTQKILQEMEKTGIELKLGSEFNSEFENIELAYVSPIIPLNAPIRNDLTLNNIKIIANEDISRMINEIISIDIIGVTGTMGKTSTTHIIAKIFESEGYNVWKCSSLYGNLLSEVIIDGILNDSHRKNDVAIWELPHGTIRLMSNVKLKIGVLTNIYPEHLDEFNDSFEKYAQRKAYIAHASDKIISTLPCKKYLEPIRNDVVYYCKKSDEMGNDKCNVSGYLNNDKIQINYDLTNSHGVFEAKFELTGYYFENSIAAATVGLLYGLNENTIKQGLTEFKGISGHLEYVGEYCGRKVHFDAAFVPEGLNSTLKLFKDTNLIVLVDNPDSTTVRDKYKLGNIAGEYANTIISSGYNETTKVTDMDAANEVLRGINNPNCLKIAAEDMISAGELAIKNSAPGDTVLHIGPGVITNYNNLKEKMVIGLEKGCKKYG